MTTFYVTETEYGLKPLTINVDAIDVIESYKNKTIIKTRSCETYILNETYEGLIKQLLFDVKICGLSKLNKNAGEYDVDNNNG